MVEEWHDEPEATFAHDTPARQWGGAATPVAYFLHGTHCVRAVARPSHGAGDGPIGCGKDHVDMEMLATDYGRAADGSPEIRVYGRNIDPQSDYESVCMRVVGYRPHMSIRVPDAWLEGGEFTAIELQTLCASIEAEMARRLDARVRFHAAGRSGVAVGEVEMPWDAFKRAERARITAVRAQLVKVNTEEGGDGVVDDDDVQAELEEWCDESDDDDDDVDGGESATGAGAPRVQCPPHRDPREPDMPLRPLVLGARVYDARPVNEYGDGRPVKFMCFEVLYPQLVVTLRDVLAAYNGVDPEPAPWEREQMSAAADTPQPAPARVSVHPIDAQQPSIVGALSGKPPARRHHGVAPSIPAGPPAPRPRRSWLIDPDIGVLRAHDGTVLPRDGFARPAPDKFSIFEADIAFTLRWAVDNNIESGVAILRVLTNHLRVTTGASKTSTCDREFRVHYGHVKCVRGSHDHTDDPTLADVKSVTVKASFDLEMETTRTSGFPDPSTHACCVCERNGRGVDVAYYRPGDGDPTIEHPRGGRCRCPMIPIIKAAVTVDTYVGVRVARRTYAFSVGDVDSSVLIEPKSGARVMVYCVDSESKLVSSLHNFLIALDPDILSGYNIMNFDLRYMFAVAEKWGIMECTEIGRQRGYRTVMKARQTSSRAKGTHKVYEGSVPGRVVDDLLTAFMQSKLPLLPDRVRPKSNTLNACAAYYLGPGVQKLEMDHHKQGEMQRQRATRTTQVIYNAWDTILTSDIDERVTRIDTLRENAALVGLSVADIVSRGVTMWVLSCLMRRGKPPRRGGVPYMFPWHPYTAGPIDAGREKYDGATVLEPVTGYHTDPVATLDFSSLYPSIMMAHNLCFTTLVTPEEIAHNGFVRGTDVHNWYGDFWFVDPRVRKGLVPELLVDLLRARGIAKRMMATAADPFKRNLLNARQAAVKVVANSVYGFTGATHGRLPCLPVAKTITGIGRQMIEYTRERVETRFQRARGWPCDTKVLYGDSVTGDTAIVVRERGGYIRTRRIDELASADQWRPRGDKEVVMFVDGELCIWGEKGFTAVQQLVRHRCDKPIVRVCTPMGIVDATVDHSLLRPDGTEVSPLDVEIGAPLLHTPAGDCPCVAKYGALLTEEEAYTAGVAFAGGHVDHMATWIGLLMVNAHKERRVPADVLSAPLEILQKFWRGYRTVATVRDTPRTGGFQYHFVQRGKEACAGLWIVGQRLGYDVTIAPTPNLPEHFRMTFHCGGSIAYNTHMSVTGLDAGVPQIAGDFVYDITTATHHFGVGPGLMVVHNTDSVMPRLSHGDARLGIVNTEDARKELTPDAACLMGTIMAAYVSARLRSPMKLEFEKVLIRSIIYSKKRYAAYTAEGEVTDRWKPVVDATVQWLLANEDTHERPDVPGFAAMLQATATSGEVVLIKKKKQLMKGVESVRRDAPGVVERMFNETIRRLLVDGDVKAMKTYVRDELETLVLGKQPLEDLVMSKQLRNAGAYKTKPEHVLVKEAMEARQLAGDPTPAPVAGDRVPYIIVHAPPAPKNRVAKKRDMAEHPDYAKAVGLVPNIEWYLEHQLQKPLARLLAPALSDGELSELLYTGEHVRKRARVDVVQALRAHEEVERVQVKARQVRKRTSGAARVTTTTTTVPSTMRRTTGTVWRMGLSERCLTCNAAMPGVPPTPPVCDFCLCEDENILEKMVVLMRRARGMLEEAEHALGEFSTAAQPDDPDLIAAGVAARDARACMLRFRR